MSTPEIARRGILLVLSSPSGAGKTTITRALVQSDANLKISVSVTTRPKRAGEVDGQHYHFISRAAFDEMVAKGELLEHAVVFGNCYGTPRAPVEAVLGAGGDIVSDIDWQGTQQLKSTVRGDLVSVFILPPSMAALARIRLHHRQPRPRGERPPRAGDPRRRARPQRPPDRPCRFRQPLAERGLSPS